MECSPVTVTEPSEKDWLILIDFGAIRLEASRVRVCCQGAAGAKMARVLL